MEQEQKVMQQSYMSGISGVFVSGFIWCMTSGIIYFYWANVGIYALLIWGVLIAPISSLIDRNLLKLSEKEAPKILKTLVMESTVWMIIMIPWIYALSSIKIEWFFQGMLMLIAWRYLIFQSIFWEKIYWILGVSLGCAAYILFSQNASAWITTLVGWGIEILIWIMFLVFLKKRKYIKT